MPPSSLLFKNPGAEFFMILNSTPILMGHRMIIPRKIRWFKQIVLWQIETGNFAAFSN
jgi:hypothetical protein